MESGIIKSHPKNSKLLFNNAIVTSRLTIYFFTDTPAIGEKLIIKIFLITLTSLSIITVFIKLLQDRYGYEASLKDFIESKYLDLEKNYLIANKEIRGNIELNNLWEKKIKNEKIFTDFMKLNLKIYGVRSLLNITKFKISELPIVIYEGSPERIDIHYWLNILKDFLAFDAKKRGVNLNIDYNLQEVKLDIAAVSFAQIIFGLSSNLLEFVPDNENITLKIIADDIELKIILVYTGFGLNERDIVKFKTGEYINPFILNWMKLFELLKLCKFRREIIPNDSGGEIIISKYLSNNVYIMPKGK